MNFDRTQSSSSGYIRPDDYRAPDDEYRPYFPPPPPLDLGSVPQNRPFSALTDHVKRYQQIVNSGGSHPVQFRPQQYQQQSHQRPQYNIPPPPSDYRPHCPDGYRYGAPQPTVPQWNNQVHQQRVAPPFSGAPQWTEPMRTNVPRPSRAAFFCTPCSKPFDCEEELEIHIAETHVLCTHPGCTFSGREDLVRAHKVKHAIGEESPEEVAAWIAMRRHRFPKKRVLADDAVKAPVMGKLEKHLRASMRAAQRSARAEREARSTQAPCIHWERSGKCKFGDGCGFAHAKTGVCSFFLNHGKCRHGDTCKYSHVRRSSKELAELRDPHGQLLKKLLSPEMTQWENAVLQVIRHAVNSGFFTQEVSLVDEPDERSDHDDHDDEDGDYSPISQ